MSYYLQMDGVDDWLRTPSISYDEVILDFKPYLKTATLQFFMCGSSDNPSIQRTAAEQDLHWDFSTFTIDGVPKTNGTFLTNSLRVVARGLNKSDITQTKTVDFSRRSNGLNYAKMDIYNIKFLNNGSLVAHYDMTTGTVQDQTGNGNHATLTGGTWLDDGASGGTVIDAGTITLSGDTTITINGSTILDGVSSLNADTTFDTDSSLILNGDSTFSAISSLESDGSVIYNGVVSLSANTSLDAIVNLIVNGISSLSADGTLTVDAITFDPSKQIITKIQLNGVRELTVKSEGQRELTYQVTTTRNLITKLEGES